MVRESCISMNATIYLERSRKEKTRLVPGQNWEDYRVPAGGVACYSSKDLMKWKYEGIALAASTSDPDSDLDTGRIMERPKVIFNKKTGKFVMWLHVDNPEYSYARAGVAISDSPEGPYRYLGSMRPNEQECRDLTLFKDDDEKAYVVYASENNNTMHVCLLSEDYLSPTRNYTRILIDQRREAPALFKYGTRYFLITSLCSGWSPNAATIYCNRQSHGVTGKIAGIPVLVRALIPVLDHKAVLYFP
ncbi:MAG: glycoside hydrolase family 43 protein [Puia sp.]